MFAVCRWRGDTAWASVASGFDLVYAHQPKIAMVLRKCAKMPREYQGHPYKGTILSTAIFSRAYLVVHAT